MLSSDSCSCKCNHTPLARLCSDELWEGAWGGIVSVLTLWLRQFQHRLPLLCLLQCSLPQWRGYSGSSHRDTTTDDCSGISNPGLLGQSESTSRRTGKWRSRHPADKAISDPKIGKEWSQRTNRLGAFCTWKKPCRKVEILIYQDCHSKFDYSVRDAIRRGAGEKEVQKHEGRLTSVWRQMSTLRRRYERWCKGDDIEDCTHKQRYEESYQSMVKVLQQNTWIDDRKFLKSCVRATSIFVYIYIHTH